MNPLDEGYTRWRSRYPWSNEQIALALEQVADETTNTVFAEAMRALAEKLRSTQHLTVGMMRVALPVLVSTCCLCGKTTHYRRGILGFCREHRR